jgi:hypothetical protein
VDFPNLNLSFVPMAGEAVYAGRTFVASFFLRAAWPIFSSLTAGAEAGFRWALFPQLLYGEKPDGFEPGRKTRPAGSLRLLAWA